MKNKLQEALGFVGVCLYYLTILFSACFPIAAVVRPMWLFLLLVAVIISVPVIGDILDIVMIVWAAFIVFGGGNTLAKILLIVCFAIRIWLVIGNIRASRPRKEDE